MSIGTMAGIAGSMDIVHVHHPFVSERLVEARLRQPAGGHSR